MLKDELFINHVRWRLKALGNWGILFTTVSRLQAAKTDDRGEHYRWRQRIFCSRRSPHGLWWPNQPPIRRCWGISRRVWRWPYTSFLCRRLTKTGCYSPIPTYVFMGHFDNSTDYQTIHSPVQCILLLFHLSMPKIRYTDTETDIKHTLAFYFWFRLSFVWFKEAVAKNHISTFFLIQDIQLCW